MRDSGDSYTWFSVVKLSTFCHLWFFFRFLSLPLLSPISICYAQLCVCVCVCLYLVFVLPLILFSQIGHSIQSLSCVWLFVTPWTAARQASLSITNSQSLPKLMSIESVMPPSHLILCHSLLLLPSIFPSIRVFLNEYWSFCFKWVITECYDEFPVP